MGCLVLTALIQQISLVKAMDRRGLYENLHLEIMILELHSSYTALNGGNAQANTFLSSAIDLQKTVKGL